MNLSDIHINPKNPRIIKDGKFEKLCKSIQEFPKMLELRPIIVDPKGMILGGNMRFKALQQLKMDIKPEWVKQADSLTDEEVRRFIIEDNVGFGEWDWDELANEYDKEELESWGLDVEKWAEDEIVEDEPPAVEDVAVSVTGEIYQLGNHRLMCGDATKIEDVEKLMNGQKADMVFTDPPYGVEYEGGMKEWEQIKNDGKDNFCDFLTQALTTIKVVSKEGAGWYVWHGVLRAKDVYQAFDNIGEEKRTQIIWNKNRLAGGWGDYRYKHECCVYRNGQFYGGRDQTTVWDVAIDQDYVHPTQKPIQLINMALKNSSKEEDNILDLFGGSGSTLIACEQTNRTCYMMELDPKYCDVIRKRYAKFIGKEEQWQEITPIIK